MISREFLRRSLSLAALVFLLLFLSIELSHSPSPGGQSHAQEQSTCTVLPGNALTDSRAAAKAAMLNLPLSFEPAEHANLFLVRGGGYRLLLTSSQTTVAFKNEKGEGTVRLALSGANVNADAEALDPLPGKQNYLITPRIGAPMCPPFRGFATRKSILELTLSITVGKTNSSMIFGSLQAPTRSQ